MRPLCADWREAGVETALRRRAPPGTALWLISGPIEQAAEEARESRSKAALMRVQLGAALERALADECDALCPLTARGSAEDAVVRQASQLYFDAYAIAVWTSAHAEYLVALEEGHEEPGEPSPGSFPCAASAIDLSDLFARRSSPKETGVPKAAEPLVQLLARCTNPGARGWDTVLQAALDTDGVRTLVHDMVRVCLTGMHAQLHPRARPPWDQRLVILRVSHKLLNDRKDLVKAAAYVKDAVRRSLASTLTCDAATHAALASLGHPVRHLNEPPAKLPHVGMEAAMIAFARAGADMAAERGASRKISLTLRAAFVVSDDTVAGEEPCMAWDQSWLGTPACISNHHILAQPPALAATLSRRTRSAPL